MAEAGAASPPAPAPAPALGAPADLEPREGDDIIEAALKVLHTADPHLKARRTDAIVQMWQDGRIGMPAPGARHPPPPPRPARESSKVRGLWGLRVGAGLHAAGGVRVLRVHRCRPWLHSQHTRLSAACRAHANVAPHHQTNQVKLVAARECPRRGRGGTLASRQALLHSLVHIENAAVDLAW